MKWLTILAVLVLVGCGGGDDPPPLTSEGKLTDPLFIGVTPADHQGMVGDNGVSFYVATSAIGVHRITISNLLSDADLEVFAGNPPWTNFLCSSFLDGTKTDSCITPSFGGADNLWILVTAADPGGTSFLLTTRIE